MFNIYRVVQKNDKTVRRAQSQTARRNFTKLHTIFFQHVLNHIVNFQSEWTTNVEITVA